MRISDWSSDVCSSDLIVLFGTVAAAGIRTLAQVEYRNNMNLIIVATSIGFGMIPIAAPSFYHHFPAWLDRKSVVKGQSVSARVDLGGRRSINKKTVHTDNSRDASYQ